MHSFFLLLNGLFCAALALLIAAYSKFSPMAWVDAGICALLGAFGGTALWGIGHFLLHYFFPKKLLNKRDCEKTFPTVPLLAELGYNENKMADFHLMDAPFPTRLALEKMAQELAPLTLLYAEQPYSGCSFVAANLALLSAKYRRTVLVDANLRGNDLHRSFALASSPGVSDVLLADASLDKALKNPVEGSLWVLPSGTQQPDNRLLDGGKLKRLLKELSTRFDAVIVDFPHGERGVLFAQESTYICVVGAGLKVDALAALIAKRQPTGILLNHLAK